FFRQGQPCLTLEDTPFFFPCLHLFHTPIYSSHVDSWQGQENDLVEDAVQEGIFRTFKYARQADNGEVPPITCLKRMSIVIAHNYCRDLRRRDQRLLHISTYDCSYGEDVDRYQFDDPSEIASDELYREWLFVKISQDI